VIAGNAAGDQRWIAGNTRCPWRQWLVAVARDARQDNTWEEALEVKAMGSSSSELNCLTSQA
jgi:hypothetical protein